MSSRETLGFLMTHKLETQDIIAKFLKFIRNQFNATPKIIRTDNGKKFVNKTTKTLFTLNGIIHQLTYPYTPQQNGMVKHKHQHLLQVARAIRFQSRVPIEFWGHCIMCTVHIINRLPFRKLGIEQDLI